MRNPNNMLKSALMTLALATASLAAFSSTARAADGSWTAEAPTGKTPAAADTPTPMPLPRPVPPIVSDAFERADLNHDGIHNMDDLVLLLAGWGSCPAGDAVCTSDISLDGFVDDADLLFLLRLIALDSNQGS